MITHVAFIMDGNRRWAKKRHLPAITGHTKGYQKIEPLIVHATKLGIKHITFWAFSTENWKRNKEEIDYLMHIFRKVFKGKIVKRLIENGGKIVVLGNIAPFPQDIQDNINNIIEQSKNNTKIVINIALNYGGRLEILHAIQAILKEHPETEITEDFFSRHLYTGMQPDPDLIIRTGGEQRLSGFLPWQAVYSELYFTETYWPDFDEKEFDQALDVYKKRERRYGK